MKTSVVALALALSGSAVGAPFSSSTRVASGTPSASTPAHLSSDPPLPDPFASSSARHSSSAAPSSGSVPYSRSSTPTGSAVKRGEAGLIPTGIPSLLSDAQSVVGALASAGAGAQKRGEALSIPTDLPSLVSDAQSVVGGLASAGAQKRGDALALPTDLPSLVSDAQSAVGALASAGAQKRDDALSLPTDIPSLVEGVQSLGASVASAGAQKRGDALALPTDLPSLVSDAQSAVGALASAGAQKRGDSPSLPTDIPSLLSGVESLGAAVASAGGQKRAEQTIPILTPTGLPTPSRTLSTRPASSAVASSSGAASSTVTPSPTGTPTGAASSGSARPSSTVRPHPLFPLVFPPFLFLSFHSPIPLPFPFSSIFSFVNFSSYLNRAPSPIPRLNMKKVYTSVLAYQAGLPDGFILRPFSESDSLKFTFDILLEKIQEDGDGSQWIILVALAPPTVNRLADPVHPMENLSYRAQWEGAAALIKVVADCSHLMMTDELTRAIDYHIAIMQNPPAHKWNANAAHMVTPTKGIQADDSFSPQCRLPGPLQTSTCPTLVIETGLPLSLPRLRENAKGWFANTNGHVRIVLVLVVGETGIRIEKWQLAPPFAPRPLNEAYIESLREQYPPIPPLAEQLPAVQQAYSAQEIEVSGDRLAGGPLVLPFVALFDQLPGQGDHDVVLGEDNFRFVSCII
ncbi:unnamed protein product [Penicillium olsonii]|uniref:Uncharacterized protein n=1 Tax=Penicillium olsonii TaxID=99116 RepID=A0A9W4HUD4_PENOL|nr:unnamed protein product [Penicillium olsonii]